MELWTIGSKAVVLGYIVMASFLINFASAASPWHILAYLLYLVVNIAVPIFTNIRLKQFLIARLRRIRHRMRDPAGPVVPAAASDQCV